MKKILCLKSVYLLCLLFVVHIGFSQADTSLLPFNVFAQHVMNNHPLARQAALKDDFVAAEWLAARGHFDPVLSSGWSDKFFDDKHYYRLFSNQLNIPLRYGIEIEGTYENTAGVYLNPEHKTDENGLWSLGVKANLLQGLLIDERRAGLQKAEFYQKIAESQKASLLNDLLFQASQAYLLWQKDYFIREVIREGIDLAIIYFEATRISYLNGEKTAIDTLEARMILQDREALLQANESLLVKSKQQLEQYLWIDGLPAELPLLMSPGSREENIFVPEDSQSVADLVNVHPLMLEKQNKKAYYEIEQRLKKDKLKPKLKVKYNPLLGTSSQGITPVFSAANFKWGIDFSMPLFFRSERAGLQQSRLKIQEVEYDILDKRNVLENKIKASLDQQKILLQQLQLQQKNIEGYLTLLEAEYEKNLFGESSVFLINKRQEKYLEGRVKLIELNMKYKMEQLNYLYLSNRLLSVVLN